MATIELGAFIVLNLIGVIGFLFVLKWKHLLFLSILAFGSLSLALLSEYSVVITEITPAHNSTSTNFQTVINATTGDPITNTTQTQTVLIPEVRNQTCAICGLEVTFGYFYLATAFAAIIIWFARVFSK